ncbi:MAG TPA: Sec-independent protein translocase subunit TatA [Jatrophihabitans sp.]|jgi:sec-independent protein translocase protein TatA|uniref:Sec-independent protein translocase subunit TatA n=1 Tax=Jatrophihabitans sp. TaxID=1932789 RepID=UPI002F137693
MTGWTSPSHWVIIALLVLVLFGYKKLPEMSRSVGRSLRIFKTEIKGMDADDAARNSAETGTPGAAQPQAVTPPAVSSPVVAPPVVTPPPVTPSAVAPVTPAQTTPSAAEETSQRTQA